MPRYIWRCDHCCGELEKWLAYADYDGSAAEVCPACGQPMRRVVSVTPVHYRGDGWGRAQKLGDAKNGGSAVNSDGGDSRI